MGWKGGLMALGVASAMAAGLGAPGDAGRAAGQVWPAFVLVAGLLLVGLVAAEDGLFAWLGDRLGALPGGRLSLVVGVTITVALVTAVLNLDTSVAFLSPILVHAARRRGLGAGALLALCVLLSNAGSLLLPGSNLTNLIVLGGRSNGLAFASRMVLPWLVAVVVTALVSALIFTPGEDGRPATGGATRPEGRIGAVSVAAVVGAVLVTTDPAVPVMAIGALATGWRLLRRQMERRRVAETVDFPVLAGLFGLAVALGALGRVWAGPSRLSNHIGPWATAGLGAVASVVVNNLPAAAILSARPPAHPLSLLIGLDLGPNLFVTGSLAWVLWYGACRSAGAEPDLRRTVAAGVVSAPLAGLGAVGMLLLATGRT